ncbi:predicted protein [Botrytis cinerea T4]|uniref:Uncharacterized protein n=1 Tax=Botryotinia fuckeliana (strain T4) TaxID=999810 RepID=G2YFA5_BOTF4|nr:predicted protein [Botrytis cinerea T4]
MYAGPAPRSIHIGHGMASSHVPKKRSIRSRSLFDRKKFDVEDGE